jgi:DNA-binding FadR family transcriptional regulator
MRPARLAEVIAGDLRDQILRGDLGDGDRLPPLDGLVEHYKVSGPSIREALRVLETEGLISIRLGRSGGATVHQPRPERAAYMLGLLLEAQRVRVSDLDGAILELTLACARTCARREDRALTVVPALRASLQRASDADTPDDFAAGMIDFHKAIISECGNQTLVLVVGALVALWGGQQVPSGTTLIESDEQVRAEVIAGHWSLLASIESGHPDDAVQQLYHLVTFVDPKSSPTRRPNPIVKAKQAATRWAPVPSEAGRANGTPSSPRKDS